MDKLTGAKMRQSFTILQPAVPLSFRLPLLIGGLLLLAFGLVGLVRAGPILVAGLFGETPWPPHFAIGSLVTLVATGLGVAMIRPCLFPETTVVFDASTQEVRVTERYPFGIRRRAAFAFADMRPPEVFWHKDQEYSVGGYWELKVTFPDGRTVTRAPDAVRQSDQKDQAEAWRAEILRMRR